MEKQASSWSSFGCGVENPIGLHIDFYPTRPGELKSISRAGRNRGQWLRAGQRPADPMIHYLLRPMHCIWTDPIPPSHHSWRNLAVKPIRMKKGFDDYRHDRIIDPINDGRGSLALEYSLRREHVADQWQINPTIK